MVFVIVCPYFAVSNVSIMTTAMRRLSADPDLFLPSQLLHKKAKELAAIDAILVANPAITEAVWKDLQRNKKVTGRPGLSADQVLRTAIIKQLYSYSYEDLPFHIADSDTNRRFCYFVSAQAVPGKSTLARGIKSIRRDTWHRINRILMGYANDKDIEDGKRVRIDPTVTETNIHPPTDNSLLFDCVRVIDRLLCQARAEYSVLHSSHSRRAKRRHLQIMNAPNDARRLRPYKDLLKVTRKTIGYAKAAVAQLSAHSDARAQSLAAELSHYSELSERVIDQTERRVLKGESVPAQEKILSIFEPHTDVIRKDRRDTYYGHKVTLSGGKSGLVLDWVVETGNPADSTLLMPMLDRLTDIYGRVPDQVSVDGGFASRENLRLAKKAGVTDMAFAKKRGLRVEDMTSTPAIYRMLRDFRAGIEAIISFLKRSFGMRRCTWQSFASFGSYVGASIVTANLLMLARHLT